MDTTVIIARIVFVLYLALIAYCVYRGTDGRPGWYWTGAALVYAMSVLFAMSIGGYTIAAAFALAGAASVYLVRRTPTARTVAMGAILGIAIWGVWVALADITFIFAPVLLLGDLFFGD